MKIIYSLLSFFVFVLGFGQNFNPSDRDPNFNAFNVPLNHCFIDTEVTKSTVLSDGKIMVLKRQKEIVKLDGNLKDTSFTMGTFIDGDGFTAILQTFAVQPDGKILVGGNFKSYNGQIIQKLARLNANGSLDTTFNPPLSMLGSYGVLKIELQQDGKIVFVGDTAPTSSNYFNNLGRLNTNGSIDNSFVIPINYRFANLVIQSDGKMIVTHNTYNDFYSNKNKLSRLNTDGSFDTGFTTAIFGVGFGSDFTDLHKIYLQTDGKILVSGYFVGCNSVTSKDIVRLNSDGTVDTSFVIGSGGTYITPNYGTSRIYDIVMQPDNKILISGNFLSFSGNARQKIARLNQDGSLDATFLDVSVFLNINNVYSISLFSDGKILASGDLTTNKRYANYIAKINTDGTRDTSYDNFELGFFNSPVNTVLETPDGKILVGGDFHSYNNTKCFSFARLNQDGSIDNTLNYGGLGGFESVNNSFITAIAQQADGKIYLAGTFTFYNGTSAKSIIRINPDGTRDTTFSVGSTGFNSDITNILVKPAGGILVCGLFTSFQGSSCNGLASLSATGFGGGFSSSTISSGVYCIRYQTDGKLLVASAGLKRYNAASSTLDTTFTLDSSISYPPTINTMELQTDGKILIRGSFTVGGIQKSFIRLLNNGTIDPTFDLSGQSSTYKVASFTITPDQKFLIFIYDSNTYINKIVRLNNNGTIDTSFAQQNYDYEEYYQSSPNFKVTNNGKILVYGKLYSYQEKPARGLIRLMGENYYFLQGQNRLDANVNGCDTSDNLFSNMKYHITDSSGLNNYDFIADTSGIYNVSMVAGNYTVVPTFENPAYFASSPTNISIAFPSQTSPQLQNFCITPTGNHPDLEVYVIPINSARPGFDAKYKIIYKNKGNQLQSGTVNLAFEDAVLDLVISSPVVTNQSLNNLSWNFTNLAPFETRQIVFTLNVNSPSETPAVIGGDELSYTATISSITIDEIPSDNSFELPQTVVNSYDPNDKTCLEGSTITTTKVGDYVHYMIRFENTGTYAAQNIRVRDVIDVNKYDINTLVPISGSYLFTTKISEGNIVDFYFENINLPFADDTNDGYVAFKIKTKSTLVAGDSFSNSAAIYFDYNSAINTNTATTIVQGPLAIGDFIDSKDIVLYPNPVKDILNISEKASIEISSINIYNMLGQLAIVIPNAQNTQSVDVSSLKKGSYIVKINSSKGSLNVKFIKR